MICLWNCVLLSLFFVWVIKVVMVRLVEVDGMVCVMLSRWLNGSMRFIINVVCFVLIFIVDSIVVSMNSDVDGIGVVLNVVSVLVSSMILSI